MTHVNSRSGKSNLQEISSEEDLSSSLAKLVVSSQELGAIVVNSEGCVSLWNDWIAKYSNITAQQAINQKLVSIFNELDGSRLHQAVDDTLAKGMSTVLSQLFHQHPLPLFVKNKTSGELLRMYQQINVKSLKLNDDVYAMIEVKNVSASVDKENLLKQQNAAMKDLVKENTQQKHHLENVLDSSTDAILTLSTNGTILDNNKAALTIFKIAEERFLGQAITKFVPKININPDSSYPSMAELQGITTDSSELRLVVSVNKLVENDAFVVATLRNVTHRQLMKEALYRNERLAKTALESIADGVITTNQVGKIELFNPIAATLLGLRNTEIKGKSIEEVFSLVDEDSETLLENIVVKAMHQGATINSQGNSSLVSASFSKRLPVLATASPIFDSYNRVTGSVLVFRDVQESRRLSTKLSWEASHDTLTGLANRRAFNQRLETVVNESLPAILLFLDLDRFKLVNDTAGHSIGDELLKRISEMFVSFFREGDFISRLGGDEFAVILEHCPLEKARELAQNLCTQVEQYPFPWEDRIFTVGVSIGLSQVLENDNSPSKVIERADAACYSAKQTGRSRVHVYGESQQETEYQEKINRASAISEAIAHERFVLYKQPIVSICKKKRQLHHYEILIRMLDDNNNIIPPNDFIPAAEQFGLMQSVDRFVITKVVRFIQNSRTSQEQVSFAINLSGASIIDERFLTFLDELITREEITSQDMHFEITETAAISNLAKARVFLEHFNSKGFSFALDDFGSGMSSFGYLKNLPIDYIKIDGQFVKEIVGNETDFAMVSSINYLGHMMGLKCIAEFVENDEIYDVLDQIGVDFAQGYGIEKPTPLFELSKAS